MQIFFSFHVASTQRLNFTAQKFQDKQASKQTKYKTNKHGNKARKPQVVIDVIDTPVALKKPKVIIWYNLVDQKQSHDYAKFEKHRPRRVRVKHQY